MTAPPDTAARPAHLGWRLLALVYDTLPALAIWLLTSAVVYALRGGVPVTPGSLGAWLELALLWAVTGAYAVLSWRRGGQTLGMRPWRLKVVAADGHPASVAMLWRRYAVASLTLGLALLWSLIDDERRGLHDLAADTLLVRLPEPGRG